MTIQEETTISPDRIIITMATMITELRQRLNHEEQLRCELQSQLDIHTGYMLDTRQHLTVCVDKLAIVTKENEVLREQLARLLQQVSVSTPDNGLSMIDPVDRVVSSGVKLNWDYSGRALKLPNGARLRIRNSSGSYCYASIRDNKLIMGRHHNKSLHWFIKQARPDVCYPGIELLNDIFVQYPEHFLTTTWVAASTLVTES